MDRRHGWWTKSSISSILYLWKTDVNLLLSFVADRNLLQDVCKSTVWYPNPKNSMGTGPIIVETFNMDRWCEWGSYPFVGPWPIPCWVDFFCAKHVLEWVGGGYFPGFSFSKNNQVFVQGQKHLRRKIMWNIICFSHFLLASLTIEEWSFYLLSSKCWIWCLYHCLSWRGRMEWYHPCLIVFNFSVMLFGTHKNLDHPTNQRCLYRMTALIVTLRMLACYFAAWSTEVISTQKMIQ